jgi:hypothetical protein
VPAVEGPAFARVQDQFKHNGYRMVAGMAARGCFTTAMTGRTAPRLCRRPPSKVSLTFIVAEPTPWL